MAKRARPAAFIDDPLWYKDAVIYQLHVKSFFDSNNDGIGDFAGLISKLDYIAELGVNTLWLLPFYPRHGATTATTSPNTRRAPDYGSLADAKRFIAEAHKRGLRVITELVINHTSDQHPWFQRARQAKRGSKARDFYVWSDDDQKYDGTRIIFLDTEKSNWTWDPVAGQYFWHRFYSHQPDLNFDNPQVLKAVIGVMRFWLDMGIDGLRLDAIPYLIERDGTNNENLPRPTTSSSRSAPRSTPTTPTACCWPRPTSGRKTPSTSAKARATNATWPSTSADAAHVHGPGQEDRFPITDILRQTPEIPANCQWAIFLRNHDELTLEMVTDRERDYLWNYYAGPPRAHQPRHPPAPGAADGA
jgi:maltose alpha-D-glucosyltransferase/alpha-amylase